MKVGIVGFAGAGKTTVFNTLTGLHAEVGYGSKDKANLGIIKVPDARIDRLGELYEPKKLVYAEISFVDVAGPEGERSGGEQGLDPRIVQHMRETDALVHVVRGFENPRLASAPDPVRDIRAFEEELILTDLGQIERRIERLKKERDSGREKELMERCQAHLEGEQALRSLELTPEEQVTVAGFRFLPPVYDRLVGPLMSLVGTSRTRRPPTPGNVLEPRDDGHAVHGGWRSLPLR